VGGCATVVVVGKTKVSWSIDEAVVRAVMDHAAVERRSLSSAAERLLVAGLGGEEPNGGVGADGASIPAVDSSASGSSSPPSSTSRAARSGLCVHRVPADQFCKRCDG